MLPSTLSRRLVMLALLLVTQIAGAEVISARAVSTTMTFAHDGQAVVVSTDVPAALLGTYWLKPAEFFKEFERRLTLRADGTVTTEAIGAGGGPRRLTWGLLVKDGQLRVTRYPGPVWMGSHEGENLPAYTLVLRYENGAFTRKALFESRDRLGIEGPGGMALIKQ
ncbi:hypothetical protein [Marinobacter caseinilyticus]|uniref:hypothetical protein n=1 Tax=Marinobacter caseinilyticus TaxID=2692195 RepID=UPI00140AFDC4|nr:hypothetical protein [Marinobacter caseinilyticus]